MATLRITTLVENTATGRDLLGAAGLSFWIETAHRAVLFDTGRGAVLCGNARKLGVRLAAADAIVLSHGHFDHTGGLVDALRMAWRPKIYTHPAAFAPKFSRRANGTGDAVGLPLLTESQVRESAELIWTESPTEVVEGLRLTGPVPRVTDFEDTGGAFFKDRSCTVPDDLADDQAALVDTPAGTVVILGCAHSGIINTLEYIRTLTAGRPIEAVIGGSHLVNADQRRMDATVAALSRLDVHRLLLCHCTGIAATARLWTEFPDRCAKCEVGAVIEF